MFENLEILHTASAMARHAGRRQSIVARNIANADTPNFIAQRIGSFKESYQSSQITNLANSRAGHFQLENHRSSAPVHASATEASPNGNNVALEEEMLNLAEIKREHDRALAIYRHSISLLRTSLGRQ